MKTSVKLPVMVRVENVGAIFLGGNNTTTSHTKHVDIRYNYVNEYVEGRIVEVVFVKLAENDSNISHEDLKWRSA